MGLRTELSFRHGSCLRKNRADPYAALRLRAGEPAQGRRYVVVNIDFIELQESFGSINLRTIYLIHEQQEELWNDYGRFEDVFAEVGAPFPPKEHLEHIKSNGGEKIVLLSDDDSKILGWIGIVPQPDKRIAELAGIEVNSNYRNKGYVKKLITEAQKWLSEKGISKFRFQTSPLFTSNSLLYVKAFQSEYKWNNQNTLPPDNIAWPVVDCEMEWPLSKRRIKIKDIEQALERSIITWNGHHPKFDDGELDSAKQHQTLEIPFLSLPIVFKEFRNGNFDVARIPFSAFEWLSNNGYHFLDFQEYDERYFYVFRKNKK
jgi:ribosomal protein S18 acetylase RimI-like enzyme